MARKKDKTLIGDGGTYEKPDLISKIICVVSGVVVIFLVIIGVMAYL